MARPTIIRRLAAAAVLAALSLGAAAPATAAGDGLERAGEANGKADSSDDRITIQGISWK